MIAKANRDGLVTVGDVPGEAAILVRYMGHVTVCRVTLPRPQRATFERPPENNFIDVSVWDKLRRLGIQPSGMANDATFMRRVYLDTVGSDAPDWKELGAMLEEAYRLVAPKRLAAELDQR